MPKGSRRTPKNARAHVWLYKPDPLLYELKHPTAQKIQSVKKNLGALALHGGRVTPKARDTLHPTIRDRIPVASTRRRIVSTGNSLSAAEKVLGIDIKKLHHLPATIDASELFGARRRMGGIYPIRIAFEGHPEAKAVGAKLMSTVFVSPLSPRDYMIVAYGTQGSTKLAELPKGSRIHRFYDYGMPTQALALTVNLLANRQKTGPKAGRASAADKAKKPVRVFVVGREITNKRRGINRPDVKEQVEAAQSYEFLEPEQRSRLQALANGWDATLDSEKQRVINSTIPWHRLMGLPWHVINKNYHEIPKNFGSHELPMGDVAPKRVLERLSESDPSGVRFNEIAGLPVHEIDPKKVEPMMRFIKKAR